MSISVKPGWYVDPENAGQLRYWDGENWTRSTAPKEDATETPQKSEKNSSVQTNSATKSKKKFILKNEGDSAFFLEFKLTDLDSWEKSNLEKILSNSPEKIKDDTRISYFDYGIQRMFGGNLHSPDKGETFTLKLNQISEYEKGEAEKMLKDCFKYLLSPNFNSLPVKKNDVGVQPNNLWFSHPLYKDWILLTFTFLTLLAWIPALIRVVESGGPYFSTYGIFTGLLDALVSPLFLSVIFLLPAILIRKFIRTNQ